MSSSTINGLTPPPSFLVPIALGRAGRPVRPAQAIAALGQPESPAELAQRLAVVISMLWPQVSDADLFLPEKGRPLRGVRDARAGAGLLATLNAVWGPIAARGLMPVTPTLLPGDAAAGRGSTMSTPSCPGNRWRDFWSFSASADAPAFTIGNLEGLVRWPRGSAASPG